MPDHAMHSGDQIDRGFWPRCRDQVRRAVSRDERPNVLCVVSVSVVVWIPVVVAILVVVVVVVAAVITAFA